MALTDRLPLTDGTNRVYEGIANPSPITALVEFAGQALDGYEQFRAGREEKKKADAKARAEQAAYEASGSGIRANEAVAAGNSTLLEAERIAAESTLEISVPQPDNVEFTQASDGSIFETRTPVDPVVEKDIRNAATRAQSISAAVEQGRMPPITQEAALNADFRRLREKYPDQIETILDIYGKMGLTKHLNTELQDAHDWREHEREAKQSGALDQQKERQRLVNIGRVVAGKEFPEATEDQLYWLGIDQENLNLRLDTDKKRLDAAKTNADLTESQKKSAEEDFNRRFMRELSVSTYNQATLFVDEVSKLTEALASDPNNPDALNRFQLLGPRAQGLMNQSISKMVTHAINNGYTGDTGKLEETFRMQFKPLVDFFTGDASVVKSHLDALKTIETAGKIRTAQALPIFTQLQKAGMNPVEMKSVMEAVQRDSNLSRALHEEINGFVNDWNVDRASVRIMNIQRVLRGDARLNYSNAEEAAKDLRVLAPTVTNYMKGYVAGENIPPENMLNGYGEIVVGTRALGPSTNVNVLSATTNIIASATSRSALKKAFNDPEAKEYAGAAIQASMGASAHLLNNVNVMGTKINDMFMPRGWKIDWDENSGRFRGVRVPVKSVDVRETGEGARYARMAGQQNTRVTYTGGEKTIPASLNKYIDHANKNLDNIMELGKFSGTLPQGTELELRAWYGRGIPLKNNKKPTDPDEQMDLMFDKVEDSITQAMGKVSRPMKVATDISDLRSRNPEGYDKVVPIVQELAPQYGVPVELATALIAKESTFNIGAEGPVITSGSHKGDRARGLGQVMGKTAAAFGVTDRTKLDARGEVDLMLKVIKKNFDSSGNWKDAVSMYFTGDTYEKARRRGATDGFNTVLQYVEDVLG